MAERWIGLTVRADELTLVGLCEDGGTWEVLDDDTWKLQTGNRFIAYRVIFDRLLHYLQVADLRHVAVKASATIKSGMRLSHLEAAELRGVVCTASVQAGAKVVAITKTEMSKKIGKRNTDDYVADDTVWNDFTGKELRKGSREAALLIKVASKK